ncbi:hypothetical protein F511_38243 [Dorcoceras hygrometricum]|uniref:Uncharacterized protein n=1 Tax=Dorcoceras hygrometricum TaxID=472368 RepID=A0A2Z7BUL3_9LAMI|nr:hypothetical protein F511_38243 [Dorcoceras hygrometricum]
MAPSSAVATPSSRDLARLSGEGGDNSRPFHTQHLPGPVARHSAIFQPPYIGNRAQRSAAARALARAWIQLAVGPQPLWLRNHNSGLAHRIMVKRLATSPHDPLGITDSSCKNQLVVVSVQYGPFNPYIPIRSTIIGKSRVAIDPIAMHTSWRSNSGIASATRVSMTFRVVRTNQYSQDLGLIHSTNGNHLESPNEGSSIDHQLLFTEPYVLRLPAVGDSDWRKSGSVGLLLPKRFPGFSAGRGDGPAGGAPGGG